MGVNKTKTIFVKECYFNNIPEISVNTNNSDLIEISNIKHNKATNMIAFDIVSTETFGEVNCELIARDGKNTVYTKEFIVKISDISIEYNIENIDNYYSFELNGNDYYESTNKGIDGSSSMCKLNIDAVGEYTMYLDYINSGESHYDFGMISNLDADFDSFVYNNDDISLNLYGQSSYEEKTQEYDIQSGNHHMYIKYKKDGSSSEGNDSLQFRVRFEPK